MSNNNRNETTTQQQIEIITSREFAHVLKVAGFSQADLARAINKSRSHVNNVANGLTRITLRHMQELERFLGSRLFATALAIVRKQLAEAAQRRQVEQERFVEEQRRQQEETERQERLRREQRLRELEAELEAVEQGNENHRDENEDTTQSDNATRYHDDDQDDPSEVNP
jgi:transcriptional regulator with XRE-family HTH domain